MGLVSAGLMWSASALVSMVRERWDDLLYVKKGRSGVNWFASDHPRYFVFYVCCVFWLVCFRGL